ncbi:MAG: hypothetical protein ABII00_08245 [Elusimicrobiota bacterium]
MKNDIIATAVITLISNAAESVSIITRFLIRRRVERYDAHGTIRKKPNAANERANRLSLIVASVVTFSFTLSPHAAKFLLVPELVPFELVQIPAYSTPNRVMMVAIIPPHRRPDDDAQETSTDSARGAKTDPPSY